ncbi:MAG: GNAT family N-acetyltransferase [Deltaproteobacteria bacterium]|nr:GNAT family N-acetyltransferase [Deltaproteobacteria bacterium]
MRVPISVRCTSDPRDLAHAIDVRRVVFVAEQGVREDEELDGLDPQCEHFVAEIEGRVVGTARMRPKPEDPSVAKAERVAVLRELRGAGVGRAIMAALEAEAALRGFETVLLAAQVSAIPFYERLGYEAFGEPFDDARIEHRWMKRAIRRDSRA